MIRSIDPDTNGETMPEYGVFKHGAVYVIATQREVAKVTSRQGSNTDSWVCQSRATNFSSAMLKAKANRSLCLMSFRLQLPVSLSYIWPAFDNSFRKERPISHCSSQSAACPSSLGIYAFVPRKQPPQVEYGTQHELRNRIIALTCRRSRQIFNWHHIYERPVAA
ncbi:hypothetical protein BO86DRAFT_141707 [Aspergillus japonicus CBS 114.51]|uniref:Uncharacterized protein n=2 Tax=Aspergillus TaxID=5052 RepID=A0A2V5H0B8_ASPV1|nr:hypothetical protein BO86DRAFT_141707 [Aspergillus japonicus CBS 114.51]PYI14133.1 hypothetical protein BO99DRAFT_34904 [Aspergillus violaceofuscus CBS 115571]RAH86306.1 hypothetical protein BO86DRAFT_141707 [Aspergillus japonicus CBS 114.51]